MIIEDGILIYKRLMIQIMEFISGKELVMLQDYIIRLIISQLSRLS